MGWWGWGLCSEKRGKNDENRMQTQRIDTSKEVARKAWSVIKENCLMYGSEREHKQIKVEINSLGIFR